MNWLLILGWAVAAAIFVTVVYWVFVALEHVRCVYYKRQIPFVPSARIQRRAVVSEIRQHYPHMKTVCEIGSGYGGLARCVARRCKMDVVALENMPFTYFVARLADFIFLSRVQTRQLDAFAHLDTGARYDIGVAYLGPGVNPRLAKYSKNFKVLITLDVPVVGLTPVRVVPLKRGYTRYSGQKYPYKLFVYEFK